MQPVLRLIHDHRVGPVEHRVVDLHVPPHREAVHHDPLAPAGRADPVRREPPVAEAGAERGLLLRLAVELHRAPGLHVHRVGADGSFVGIVDDVDELSAGLLRQAPDQRRVVRVELVPRRSRDHDLHAQRRRRQRGARGHRGGKRLRVPGPGQDEPLSLGLAQLLAQGHRVGERLAGVPSRALEVDDGLLAVLREVVDDAVLPGRRPVAAARKAPDAERIGVAAEHAGGIDDVLDGVAVHDGAGLGLQRPASLPRLEHHRVPAVEEHGGLEAGAGAEARVHEDHRQHLLLEPPRHLAALDPGGQPQQALHLLGAPVLQGQEVALGHASTSSRPASSRSASRWENESGGSSRSTCGSVAVPVRIRRAKSARCTSTAGRSK